MTKSNREKLIEAAIEAFSEHGYLGAGVQQIALAAGLQKPAIYYHFGNKEGLWEAVIDHLGQDFTQYCATHLKPGASFRKNIEHFMDVLENYDQFNPSGFRVLMLFSLFRTKDENRARWEKSRLMQYQPLLDIFEASGCKVPGPRFQLTAALLHGFTYSLASGVPNFIDRKQLRESVKAIDSLKP